jgi:ribosomal protein S18 acetylase RimI-like enzyme
MESEGLSYLDDVPVIFRREPRPSDLKDVLRIVQSSGFFNENEVAVAAELIEMRLAEGAESGYHFIFAEHSRKVIGFTCYGPIPGTEGSFDLYWISIMDGFRDMGLGKKLMDLTEAAVRDMGGSRIFIETSSRESYEPTRQFYANHGYQMEALLKDYYAQGDGTALFTKKF